MNQTISRSTLERRELTALDRCDACGARAWVRAVLGETELLFCAHHGTKNLGALAEAADYLQDDRHLLD
ncbi:hypothetical protein [Scrofimicrobium sp. R131]|uniref:DUF7455 domain-containing protein n=1 Tax=Scrofimicrobium appendicitidis TaxID=3079930 RepID=A0AAU7VAL5_9ACTO